MEVNDCVERLCGDTPSVLGAARASSVYLENSQVAEAAARSLAELMGGVMEASNRQVLELLQQLLRKVQDLPSLVIQIPRTSNQPCSP